jgi:hypothetical protein
MALALSSQRITSKRFLPCQNIHPEAQNNTLISVDLICPRSSSLESLVKRKMNQNPGLISFCLLCNHNSKIKISGKPPMITMCSPHFYLGENTYHSFTYSNLTECQNTHTQRCDIETIPPIHRGVHCGSRFTVLRYGEKVKITNHIPCNTGRTDTKMVILTKYYI